MTQWRLGIGLLTWFAIQAQGPLPPGVLFYRSITDDSTTFVNSVAADPAGNSYVYGWTYSDALPVTAGVLQTSLKPGTCHGGVSDPLPPPCTDTFLAKLNAAGEIQFLTYFGGAGDERSGTVAVDSSGNIWITGNTSSNDLPLTSNAAWKTLPTGGGSFVAEIDSSGRRLLYSSYIPGFSPAIAFAHSTEPGISLYLSVFQPARFSVPSGAVDVTEGNCQLMALGPDGSLAIIARFSGVCSAIVSSADDSIYITGYAASDLPVTPGAWQTQAHGSQDAYAAKLDPTLSHVLWATYIGGSGFDDGGSIRLDPEGNVWVAGTTQSPDFPVAGEPAYPVPRVSQTGVSTAGFLVRLAPDGSRPLTSQYMSGPVEALALDASGNVIVMLDLLLRPPFVATPGAQWPCLMSTVYPAALAKLNPDATAVLWSTFAGPSMPYGAMTVDTSGNAVVAGTTSNSVAGVEVAKAATVAGLARIVQQCVAQSGWPYASGSIAPGELVSIYGAGFGPPQGIVPSIGEDLTVPTQLGGVQVLVEDTPAPLLYVSTTQINFVAPYMLQGRHAAHIRILSADQVSNEVIFGVAATAPEIFQIPFQGTSYAAALNQDLTVNSPDNPAHPGEAVAIYVSGAGQMLPAATDGAIPRDSSQRVAQPVRIHLSWSGLPGMADAAVLYAGAAPGLVSGAVQINFRIPDGAAFYSCDRCSMNVGLTIGDEAVEYVVISVSP
ncbi:MAG: SBBP repeat-containing protein [Bryobacteraceae bacterium]